MKTAVSDCLLRTWGEVRWCFASFPMTLKLLCKFNYCGILEYLEILYGTYLIYLCFPFSIPARKVLLAAGKSLYEAKDHVPVFLPFQ